MMKKNLHKIVGKLGRKNKDADKTTVPRITNDKLAAYREQVIAKGKRYKYPMQQTKNRTLLLSGIIALVLLASVTFFTWWQLYKAQNTSQFVYRITQILPLPVASIDGETVRYEDYLLELRSSLHYLTNIESVNLSSDDGQRQLAFQKRQAMDKVLQQTYVNKLARENDITVTDAEADQYIKAQIENNTIGATEQDFKVVIQEYYDWTFEEYRRSIKAQLLKRKVVAAVDTSARARAEEVLERARAKDADFGKLAAEYSGDEATKANGGEVGFVRDGDPDPDGLAAAAKALETDQVSDIITGSNGLYIVKNLEERDGAVRFARILILFSEFNQRFGQLREEGKIKESIDIPEAPSAASFN